MRRWIPSSVTQPQTYLNPRRARFRLSPYTYSVGHDSSVLAGGTNHSFRTSATNARLLRVWAIGDAGVGTTNQIAVRDAYLNFTNSAATDVWLMLGDNVYELGLDEEWQSKVFDVYSNTLPKSTLWPAMGNHDAPFGSPETFLDLFTLPENGEAGGTPSGTELYYSFDRANVHFICLDSWLSGRSINSPMLNWLRDDLAATTKDWIIAFWHHPPYSMGTDYSDSTPIMIEMRENVLPILESQGVDLVLCGHSHVYERSYLLNGHYSSSWTLSSANILDAGLGRADGGGPYHKPVDRTPNSGTVYTVCGNSGQGGTIGFARHPAMAVKFDGYGSIVIDIDGSRLEAKFLRPNDVVADHFTIEKSGTPPTGPRLNLARSTDSYVLSWPVTSGDYEVECATSLTAFDWQPITNAQSVINGTNVVELGSESGQRFYRLKLIP
jgi:3',5'-cyclic AMP phosphodiesterase CpdA